MQNIIIVNTKGGSGKSTIATNLAGYYACWGMRVVLADHDPQESSLDWLAARSHRQPHIIGKSDNACKNIFPLADYVITDLASGSHPDKLMQVLATADTILIPVLPSPMDIRATLRFVCDLLQSPGFNKNKTRIGVIANRVRENTRVYARLKEFLDTLGLPFITSLRETQNYIDATEAGLSLFELPQRKVIRDLVQWQPLIAWLSNENMSVIPPKIGMQSN